METPRHFNLSLLALLGAAIFADAQVQPPVAKRYFEEAKKLCAMRAGYGVCRFVVRW